MNGRIVVFVWFDVTRLMDVDVVELFQKDAVVGRSMVQLMGMSRNRTEYQHGRQRYDIDDPQDQLQSNLPTVSFDREIAAQARPFRVHVRWRGPRRPHCAGGAGWSSRPTQAEQRDGRGEEGNRRRHHGHQV